jgi:serpin B
VAPPSDEPAQPLTDEQARTVGRAVNGLAAELFARLAATPGNVAFSPASIEAALAMTAAGARGDTQAEMLRVLHTDDRGLDAIGQALRAWDDPARETYTLRVANRLFAEDTYTFEQPYLARVRAAFAAPVERLDFVGAADPSREHINAWVAGHTRDRIRDLLPPLSIDPTTRMVLVNAVYLDAQWETPFERSATRPEAFRVDGGTSAQVETMHATRTLAYGRIDGATVIELPYNGEELAMRFVLPPAGSPPERWATAAHLSDDAELDYEEVALSLPKFRLEPPTIPLRDHLLAMGMPRPFDRARADFTGMANPPNPADRLFISSVFHKAFVRVDEDGTEAAAATAVIMATRGMGRPQGEPIVVRFDRPFLFVLRDVRTGAVLFLGRVSDPR